jgi:hypothetical protein
MSRAPHRLLLTALLIVAASGCEEFSDDTGQTPAGALVQWNTADDTGLEDEAGWAGEVDSASIDSEHEDPPAPDRAPDPRSPGLWGS